MSRSSLMTALVTEQVKTLRDASDKTSVTFREKGLHVAYLHLPATRGPSRRCPDRPTWQSLERQN